MTDLTPQRLHCTRGPDLHFDGRLIGEFTTQNKAGTKDRWSELRLWETRAGNWVAELVGASSRPGEGTIRDARVIPASVGDIVQGVLRQDEPTRQQEAMEVWGWSTAAKAFARELGWNVAQRID